MSVHTKEPWHVGETTHENGEFIETAIMAMDGDACPAVCLDFGFNNLEMRESNARRIVACVNACAGLSTENLESNVPIIELARKYNKTINERDALQAELEALRQQLASSEPVTWYVYVEEKDNGYYVDSLDDDECVDDCTNHNATVTPLYENPQSASVDELVDALEQLARLGNGDNYGNSDGNVIAQEALAKYKKGGF